MFAESALRSQFVTVGMETFISVLKIYVSRYVMKSFLMLKFAMAFSERETLVGTVSLIEGLLTSVSVN